ncbi:hypothetical protein DYE48_14080 [Halobacillus trueperi]|uniref:Uncharacterized protein n=1 Tax=Halobacillus trueperi TaxID=156205 RepID=A0A3E0J5L0_9BACI|nr:hypothetical protein DYE48_14080 [Halobacillus trueperi]
MFIPSITVCIKAAYSRSVFEILIWQRGGGEWRDSCGKKVHGETPQDAVQGGSPRSRGKRAIPRSPIHLIKVSKPTLPRSGAYLIVSIFLN